MICSTREIHSSDLAEGLISRCVTSIMNFFSLSLASPSPTITVLITEIRPESGRLIPLCNLAGAEGAKTAKPYLLSLRHRLHQLSYFLGFRLVPLH